MKEIVLYRSPSRAIKLLIGSLLFVLLGIWMLTTGNSNAWVAWASVGFFGLGIPISMYYLIDKRPQIILNTIGIFDRTILKDFINWEVIQDAYPFNIHGQKFICLVIDKDFKPSTKRGWFYKKVAKLNESLGAQELNINLSQIKIDELKFALFIKYMSKLNPERRVDLINERSGQLTDSSMTWQPL